MSTGRRWAGIAALLALVVAVIALLGGSGVGGDRSTDDRGPEGTAALAAVLAELGHPVRPLRVGLNALLRQPEGSVIFLVSAPGLLPPAVPTEGELDRLQAFVEAGSTAVVLTDFPDGFLDQFGIEFEWDATERKDREEGGPRWRESLPVLPGPLTLGGPLAFEGRGALESAVADDILYSLDGKAVVLRREQGKGRLFVLSDPTPATNRGLRRAGNLAFFVSLVNQNRRGDGVVLFDDLHAGGGDEFGVVAYARKSGFLPTIGLVLLLLGLYLWRAGARFGAILPAADERDLRASSELVKAVARLYERAGLRAHVVALLSKRLRRKVERRSGLPWKREITDAWVQRELGDRAFTLFQHCRAGFGQLPSHPDPAPDAVLALARRVHRFETEFLDAPRRVTRGGP